MQRILCKSKIHKATVTDANLNYEGSITIDEALMDAANLLPYEKVQVVNNNNGARFETYIISGKRDSGTICLNGAAARLVQPGDLLIIISYAQLDEAELTDFQPKIVTVNEKNQVTGIKNKEHTASATNFEP
ncbi:MAG TPA: aspartate 1-decarboxylase [Atribacteraceae bacterium]|nr:aspartate 1-decarboxylase [Atribacteraceae bacterium]